jgi:hypothetical protein
MDPRKLSMEPRGSSGALSRITLEPWKPIFKPYVSSWRHLGTLEGHHGAPEGLPGAQEAHLGAMEANPGAADAHLWSRRAHLKAIVSHS